MIFRKKQPVPNLDDILKSSSRMLHKGEKNLKHPFNRPSLTTIKANRPESRTVILRLFSLKDRSLICHCDARSPKVSQIRENPDVSWLFYDPKKWIQIRFSGSAAIHTDDDTAEAQWKTVRPTSRINYLAQMPPGSAIEKPGTGLPQFLKDRALKLKDLSGAQKNFAVIVCRFDTMDWLSLRLTGNLRAKFQWQDNRVNASWVVP